MGEKRHFFGSIRWPLWATRKELQSLQERIDQMAATQADLDAKLQQLQQTEQTLANNVQGLKDSLAQVKQTLQNKGASSGVDYTNEVNTVQSVIDGMNNLFAAQAPDTGTAPDAASTPTPTDTTNAAPTGSGNNGQAS